MKIGKRIASWLRSAASVFDPPLSKKQIIEAEDELAPPTPTPLPDTIDWGPEACPRCLPGKRCPRHLHWKQMNYQFHDTSDICEDCKQIRKTKPNEKCLKHTIFTDTK